MTCTHIRLIFVQHMANLLPVFDRNTGNSHLDFILLNRSGASLTFAPINSQSRSRNAHLNMQPSGISSINEKNKLTQENAVPTSLLALGLLQKIAL